jgi:pimeloyl-ACP methyl ester carboxylesterase
MATAVTMPRLGLTMVEGTVVEWKAQIGDTLEKGQPILLIESEKVEVEIEAFVGGELVATYVEPGTTVPIGALLGAIAERGETFDRDAFAASFVPEMEGAPATAPSAGEAIPPPAARATAAAAGGGGAKAAPAARALAKKLGIEIETIAGSGPGGRITVEDVERAGGSAVAPSLAIDVAGSGAPLMLVSGFGVDRTGWRPQIDTLARSFTVVSFDHRGIDGSRPAPGDGWTIAAMADDAAAALGDRRPATIVGASMGAAIAIELAIAHADAVRALVLLTPVIDKDARLDAILRSWTEFDAPQSESRIRAMLPWLLGPKSLGEAPRREAAAQALRAMAARTPIATLRRQASALGAWLGTRSDALASIRVPTLVIGAGFDLVSPRSQAERVARSISGAKLEIFEDAGHAVTIERATEVNDLVARFAAAT